MTKKEMANIITKSTAWDGASADWLIRYCTKQKLKDIYNQLEFAERDYYEDYYERKW